MRVFSNKASATDTSERAACRAPIPADLAPERWTWPMRSHSGRVLSCSFSWAFVTLRRASATRSALPVPWRFDLKFVLEHEAGIRHRAFGGKHVVLGVAKIVAGFVERLGVALALARSGFGFSSLQTGAHLLVIEADQKFSFFDRVVPFHGDFGNASEKLCADANEAGFRLDATGRCGNPVDLRRLPSRLSKCLRRGLCAQEIAARNRDCAERRRPDGQGEQEKFCEKSSSWTAKSVISAHVIILLKNSIASRRFGAFPRHERR